jgi:hypothetical protein
VSDVNAALAAAQRPVPPARPAPQRRAFILGNTGKLGEEMLNVLLESAHYRSVCVGVRKAMRSHVAKLESVTVPASLDGWNPAAAMQQAPEDIYLCVEPSKSFWKLPKPYVAITSAQAAQVACRMRASGARRVVVVTPLEAILQMGMAPAIRDADEMEIVQAGFERILVLRPSQDAHTESSGNLLRQVGNGVVRVLGSYMTPKELQPLRARRVAQVTVDTLMGMSDGVQVLGAARLRELVGDPMQKARL